MASVLKQRTARRTLLGSLAGLILALATVLVAPAASADIPPVDAVVTSPNMRHLANIPKQGPLAPEDALGSDWAFKGNFAIGGNYNGFTVYDISTPAAPKVASVVSCPGPQNDVTITGNVLVLSTDSSRSNDSCQSTPLAATNKDAWEGIKLFDISDIRNPRYIKSVETKCGSHTHTAVPGKGNTSYVYVSSFFPASTLPDCQPPHDQISIVKVPLNNPSAAALIAEPNLFPDGGNPGDGRPFPEGTSATSGCHDLTAYPDKDLMAGACMGDGVLFDISNRERPRTIHTVRDDQNFAFWHSATFNNRANKVVFTDELGGGGQPICNPQLGPNKGADAIYDIVGKGDQRRMVFRSLFKIPRENTQFENCVAHNGSLIPVKGRDIMVQAWYQGGVSVWEFTNSSQPREIAWFERGPLSDSRLIVGGSWSAYYYNGTIYSNDIQKGLDVLDVRDSITDPAKRIRLDLLNVQTQPNYFD